MEAFRLFDPPGCAVKVCTKCKIGKPLDEFGKRPERPWATKSWCKSCHNADNANRQRHHRAVDPAAETARLRRKDLKSRFGVTLEWFDSLLASQGGRCAICGTDTPGGRGAFHVDHCHTTGAVRRLLCHNCNVGLGHFRDDPVLLVSATHYLLEFQTS